jgi:SM-20-related protein
MFDADGVLVLDGFASIAEVAALRACAHARRQRGEFKPARIGGGAAAARHAQIRGDSICWLQEPLAAAEVRLLAALEAMRLELNRQHLLGLFELEIHYAWYPAGAGYAAHVDQPHGSEARRVSLALYLNDAWVVEDGGELQLNLAGGELRQLQPLGGRLVAFLSAGREHEVLECRRERMSLTGWFRTRG